MLVRIEEVFRTLVYESISEIVNFFRQNAHDLGNTTWEKTKTLKKEKQNNDCHSNERG